MADKQRTPAARGPRRIGPRLAPGLVVTLVVLVLGGCVGAVSSSGAAAPTLVPSPPAVVAPPNASNGVGGEAAPCLSATNPGELCGGGPFPSPPPDAGSLPSTPAAFPTTAILIAPAEAPAVVTIAHDGTTLHLAVGQRFLLDLGSGVDWTVTVGDKQVLQPVTSVPLPAGAQGFYEGRTPGTTVLSAVGAPHCTAAVCPLFRLGFSVTIRVS